VNHFYSYS